MLVFSFNSVGFAFDAHYCEGELQSISFFGKAEKCEMGQEKSKKPCCKKKKKNDGFHKKSCCHNELVFINSLEDFQGEDETSLSKRNLEYQPKLFAPESTPSLCFNLARIPKMYLDLPPPFVRKSELSVIQVFII